MASGLARRFGSNKLLADFGGELGGLCVHREGVEECGERVEFARKFVVNPVGGGESHGLARNQKILFYVREEILAHSHCVYYDLLAVVLRRAVAGD